MRPRRRRKADALTREIFIAEQRPRLVWRLPNAATLTNDGRHLNVRIDGELENIGKTPALNVIYFGKLYFPATTTESVSAQGLAFYSEHLQQALGHQFSLTSVLPTEKVPIRFTPHGIEIATLAGRAFTLCLAFHAKYELGHPGQVAEIGAVYMLQPLPTSGTLRFQLDDFQTPKNVALVELPGTRRIT